MLALAREADLLDGYLENQVFAPGHPRTRRSVGARRARRRTALPRPRGRGAQRPAQCLVLAWRAPGWRRAVRHDVPLGRGRALSGHRPAKPRASLTAKRVTAQVASLKWSRPEYAAELRRRFGAEVDYRRRPAEDFARVLVEYEDDGGLPVLIGDHVLELRRPRAPALDGGAGARVLDARVEPRHRGSSCS